jgi:hypothetical protein
MVLIILFIMPLLPFFFKKLKVHKIIPVIIILLSQLSMFFILSSQKSKKYENGGVCGLVTIQRENDTYRLKGTFNEENTAELADEFTFNDYGNVSVEIDSNNPENLYHCRIFMNKVKTAEFHSDYASFSGAFLKILSLCEKEGIKICIKGQNIILDNSPESVKFLSMREGRKNARTWAQREKH